MAIVFSVMSMVTSLYPKQHIIIHKIKEFDAVQKTIPKIPLLSPTKTQTHEPGVRSPWQPMTTS